VLTTEEHQLPTEEAPLLLQEELAPLIVVEQLVLTEVVLLLEGLPTLEIALLLEEFRVAQHHAQAELEEVQADHILPIEYLELVQEFQILIILE